jgi:OPT family oligopeptide transporter
MSEQKKFIPFVSAETTMAEFTLRGLVIGLIMSVVLGAANAYLGLRAGMTIAATYPAAVIGMAILRMMKGSILEENFARTVGSIGESVAAGAIFTLPAFFIAGIWQPFFTPGHYITSSLILVAGGILGIMFVALLRRIMVEDVELTFPESVAAAEIHKAGRTGAGNSKFLFAAMGVGAAVQALGQFKFFAASWDKFYAFFKGIKIPGTVMNAKGGMLVSQPGIYPAYMGVGYIIGPKYASLNFSGGLLSWGLLAPIIYYLVSPYFDTTFLTDWANLLMGTDASLTFDRAMSKVSDPAYQIGRIWFLIVRPIAIGGMLMGAVYTLFKMRKSLGAGLARSISDVKKAAKGAEVSTIRTEKDIKFGWIIFGIILVAIATFLITRFIFQTGWVPAIVAATVLIILAFFFAAISGYLVGIIGSSNNPISGLTLTALVITALILVMIGVKENTGGVAAVLGVAAIVCVSAAVAGEMLQDLKAGHIIGGTPWKMQVGDIIGVVIAGGIMFLVLNMLNQADIAQGFSQGYEGGFGSKNLSAPQAGLMAMLSKGIVGGQMAWPLIIVGMLMGLSFIMMQVKSPMLVSVGMYLPLETTFAIFVGGLIKGLLDIIVEKKKFNAAQKIRIENVGILLASGFIAGEALTGLGFAPFKIAEVKILEIFANPPLFIGYLFVILVALILIYVPIRNAGKPDEPAPPSAM